MKTIGLFAIGIYCLLFINFFSVGQNLSTDYIITLDGTKTFGTISRSFDFNQANSITFVDFYGKSQNLFPKDLIAFGLSNGRTFESRALPDSDDGKLVFIQVILRGRVNLLSFNSRFFVENEKEILELTNNPTPREVGGNVVMTRRRKYIGILNYMLFGPCGMEMQSKIAKTSFTEGGFIDIILAYHHCGQYPYELLVEEIPILRASLIGGAGVSIFQTYPTTSPDKVRHITDSNLAPFISLGLKLDQWRRMPRIAVDLGVGFSQVDNAVHVELDTHNHMYTATQEFSTSTIMTPVFFDYILFRSLDSEFYVGAGMNFRFNATNTTMNIIDVRTKNEPVIVELFERPVYSNSKIQFSPALKLGTHLRYKRKWGIISEVHVEYTDNGYALTLGSGQVTYNHLIASFMLGFRL
ncbi:hypothetical protein [Lunatibacter salilacus]|uniref:hypothetical protein n=1 Tax=Lunatibacter salilacus TaxID=2483804 RepID=UPI00131CA097|nr:hypothetical protein [Lunatibacter salilacus]